ncbi:MAG: conjugative transposon protein TraM [Puia sp.]|nr:conjugative transposon protein TraM [Puia sp.]
MQPNQSLQFKRKRQALLVLPLVVIPMLCVVFYGFGGGKGIPKDSKNKNASEGYNANLPGAHFKKTESIMDKLSFYEKADADSQKLQNALRADPYHTRKSIPIAGLPTNPTIPKSAGFNNSPGIAGTPDQNADQLLKTLDQLKQAMANQQGLKLPDTAMLNKSVGLPKEGLPDVQRLERLLHGAQNRTPADDPQLDKLSGMLDKIYRIQHPEIHEVIKPDSTLPGKTENLSVQAKKTNDTIGEMDPSPAKSETAIAEPSTGFIDIDAAALEDSVESNTLAAVVHSNQVLVSGATIELRLLEDAVVGKVAIPKNTLLNGLVSVNGDRLLCSITSVRTKSGIFPIALQVYDADGLPGIHVPGAISRDVAKQSLDEGINSVGATTSLDPSLGAQAASAGIQAARTLFSKKVTLIKVSVKSGYLVYLKNSKISSH